MERYIGNPILQPIEAHPWESREVFNAAAVYLNGKVHLLYRAIGNDNISRIGYASSSDGVHIDERLAEPVYSPRTAYEKDGCEDPRLIAIDDELIMAYTALREYSHLQVYQIALTTIRQTDFLAKKWKWTPPKLPFPGIRNKDGVLFPQKVGGRYVLMHRVEPDLCIAFSEDLNHWCDIRSVMGPRARGWDNWKIGGGATPIRMGNYWLVVYHGVSVERLYSLGIILLDADKPERVLYRSRKAVLSPKRDYERFGKVPNVVFSCGNVVIGEDLFIYYGAADSSVCVAKIGLEKLLASLRQ
ncbi:MAG: glycosidase [Candidatus Bathyarchaeota archaeon]|nr:glycosidase [Candidatus Bathyarchaeota archaeon]